MNCFLLLSLVACGPKHPPQAAAAETQAPAGASGLPDDRASRAFVDHLVETTIRNFSPIDDPSVRLVYRELTFSRDATWTAKAELEVEDLDETVACTEAGSWTMDPATSADQAAMTWTIEETDCPGRSSGTTVRVVATFQGDEISFKFH